MAVLVDEAVWPWRGARWAHLVSDVSIAELHGFADRLGLRRMSFQGDHYDVPEAVRAEALAMGAEAVCGRDLVRRLRGAGLRLAFANRPGRWEGGGSSPEVGPVVPDLLGWAFQAVVAEWTTAVTAAFRRSAESALVVEDHAGVSLVRSLPDGVESRRHGDRMVELLVVHGGGS
jgi:hypothetical protein